jgi:hypothetical protein
MRSHPLPAPLHIANETLAFLLEVAALAALGVWGARSGSSFVGSALRGVGAPLAAATLWGAFAAPRARIRLPMAGVLAVKALVFGSAAAAIYHLGWHRLAGLFAAIDVVNTAIATLDRDAVMRARRSP